MKILLEHDQSYVYYDLFNLILIHTEAHLLL